MKTIFSLSIAAFLAACSNYDSRNESTADETPRKIGLIQERTGYISGKDYELAGKLAQAFGNGSGSPITTSHNGGDPRQWYHLRYRIFRPTFPEGPVRITDIQEQISKTCLSAKPQCSGSDASLQEAYVCAATPGCPDPQGRIIVLGDMVEREGKKYLPAVKWHPFGVGEEVELLEIKGGLGMLEPGDSFMLVAED